MGSSHWWHYGLLLLMVTGLAGAQAPPAQDGTRPYSVQFHMHSWSNHNGAGYPASMQWHSYWARQIGLDVLWFTELMTYPAGRNIYPIDLGPARVQPGALHVEGLPVSPTHPYARPRFLVASISGGQPAASLVDGVLTWELLNLTSNFESFEYAPRVSLDPPRLISNINYARAIAMRPHIEFDLECLEANSNAQIEVLVKLSAHHYDRPVRQALLYRFIGRNPVPQRTVAADVVTVTRAALPGWQRVDLDLYPDAVLLRDGLDNAFQDLTLRVRSRNGKRAAARIRNLRIYNEAEREQDTLQAQHQVAASHGGYVGFEPSVRRTTEAGSTHYTAHFPTPASVLPPFKPFRCDYRRLASYVHQRNGIIGYAHFTFPNPASGMAPDALVSELAENLVANRCFDADSLEVGYLLRENVFLYGHLAVWDRLTANGIYVAGTGVSDSHGDPWVEGMMCGPCVTWVWARSRSAADLIEGVRARRVYFGNPFRWKGTLDLQLGNLKMGESGIISTPQEELKITLTPAPPSIVYITQALIRPGLPIRYVKRREAMNPKYPVIIDTRRPCFVRVEVVQPSGHFMVASNPIIVLKSPSISLLGPVSEITAGQKARVRWQVAGTPQRTGVQWTVNGISRFTPGRLTEGHWQAVLPVESVAAGNSVSYRVTAAGTDWRAVYPDETAAAESIQVYGSLESDSQPAALVSQVTAVPAREGAQCVVTLSAPAEVEARIVNIGGRAIRRLCDGRQLTAGVHTLVWNGRNESGLAVPAGMYLVEVRARGEAGSQSRAMGQLRIVR